MAYDNIRMDIQGGVATLTIERPKALNALNRPTLNELDAALRELAQNEQLRALIITGAGEKAFVAGIGCYGRRRWRRHADSPRWDIE